MIFTSENFPIYQIWNSAHEKKKLSWINAHTKHIFICRRKIQPFNVELNNELCYIYNKCLWFVCVCMFKCVRVSFGELCVWHTHIQHSYGWIEVVSKPGLWRCTPLFVAEPITSQTNEQMNRTIAFELKSLEIDSSIWAQDVASYKFFQILDIRSYKWNVKT